MNLNPLQSISPIDGRYRSKVQALENYFSEYALIRYRLHIEVEYFIALSRIPLPQLKGFKVENENALRKMVAEFSIDDASHVKEIEKITNHDVKAVEYFLKDAFDKIGLSRYKEFIHFGLTSQDVNNTAVPVALMEAVEQEIHPLITRIIDKMTALSVEWKHQPMLARTHGQPASPTTVGKEFFVFVERLIHQLSDFHGILFSGKFGGATGNFNAHAIAYPHIDWINFGNQFLDNLGLVRQQTTTQIEHYDDLAAVCHIIERINTILIDFSRDIWTYISFDYFKQKIKEGEVGSSTMPHKVNPIDFENAEGNLGLSNALLHHLASKLPVSRLQRDLTDSTVSRNIGVPLAHAMIAYTSLLKGLEKLVLNTEKLEDDLENNWAVVAEAIQTILRREGFKNPYEMLKSLTRKSEKITKESMHAFINSLDLTEKIKKEMLQITPQNYTGIINF